MIWVTASHCDLSVDSKLSKYSSTVVRSLYGAPLRLSQPAVRLSVVTFSVPNGAGVGGPTAAPPRPPPPPPAAPPPPRPPRPPPVGSHVAIERPCSDGFAGASAA